MALHSQATLGRRVAGVGKERAPERVLHLAQGPQFAWQGKAPFLPERKHHLHFNIFTATLVTRLGLSLSRPMASANTTCPKQPSPRGLPRTSLWGNKGWCKMGLVKFKGIPTLLLHISPNWAEITSGYTWCTFTP